MKGGRKQQLTRVNDNAHDGDEHEPESIMGSSINNYVIAQPTISLAQNGKEKSISIEKKNQVASDVEMTHISTPAYNI